MERRLSPGLVVRMVLGSKSEADSCGASEDSEIFGGSEISDIVLKQTIVFFCFGLVSGGIVVKVECVCLV